MSYRLRQSDSVLTVYHAASLLHDTRPFVYITLYVVRRKGENEFTPQFIIIFFVQQPPVGQAGPPHSAGF